MSRLRRRVGSGPSDARVVKKKRPGPGALGWLKAPGMAPDSLRTTMAAYLEGLQVRHYSPTTVSARARDLRLFAQWCEERALLKPADVTKPILERYQRHLFYARKPNGHPLSVQRQSVQLVQLRGYFRWLCRENFLPANPASELELPRLGKRLPRNTLTAAEVEKVLAVPDVDALIGLRDRAILEVLWATGLRRAEVCNLSLYDVSPEKGTVFVREGKGKRDRVVPLSARALEWVEKYLRDSRLRFVAARDEGFLFLAETGGQLEPSLLTYVVRQHVEAAGFEGRGSCHLFRHACATAMLERGADIRFVQELLGHVSLETTQIYTRVTISKLKAVYEACHPSASGVSELEPVAAESADELINALAVEAEEAGAEVARGEERQPQ